MSAEMPKIPEPVAWKTTYHGVCIPLTESKELAQHWRGYGWKVAEYYTAAQMHTFAQEAARQAMERCGKAVRAQMSTLSMHVTSRECIAHNDAVRECEDAIRAEIEKHGATVVGN